MKKKEEKPRQYTDAELRRIEKLARHEEKLAAQGYRRKNLTITALQANLYAVLVWLPIGIVTVALYFGLYGTSHMISLETGIYGLTWLELLILTLSIFVAIPIHEWLHGLTWGKFAGKEAIEYGFIKEVLTPYCTCSKPITKKQWLLGAFMPCLVLGLIPLAISLWNGSWMLFLFAQIMILSAGGDLCMILMALGHRSLPDDIFVDHPSDAGLVVFTKGNLEAA